MISSQDPYLNYICQGFLQIRSPSQVLEITTKMYLWGATIPTSLGVNPGKVLFWHLVSVRYFMIVIVVIIITETISVSLGQ